MKKKNNQKDLGSSSSKGKPETIKHKKIQKNNSRKNKKKFKSLAHKKLINVEEFTKPSKDEEIKTGVAVDASKTKKPKRKHEEIKTGIAVDASKIKKHKKTKKPKKKLIKDENDAKVVIKEEVETSNENKGSVQKIIDENNIKDKNMHIKRNARIVVRNMSFKATDESLKEHFSNFGEVLEVRLLKKPGGKLVGCAFVQFKNVPMAKKAILGCNMQPFLGRPISVDWAVPKDKYMRHIVEKDIEKESSDYIKNEIKTEDEDNGHPRLSVNGIEIKDEPNSDDDIKNSDDENSKSSSEEENSDSGTDDENVDRKPIIKDIKEEDSSIKKKSNDAEDGCTVFITNVPFSMDKEQLAEFAKKTGPIKYAVICMDQLTEHSRGSAFVKFESANKASEFINLSRDELTVDGQTINPKPALLREHLGNSKPNKQPKDNRNLYLVKEGVVIAGTKAAVGLSASDMAKRLTLEQNKTQMLRNLNRFVSRYRLVIQNLPPNYNDAKLRQLCMKSVPGRPTITEARVMRDLRSPVGTDGQHPSKGYGFVMFTRHEDALALLRKLNNNPEIFDKNNRPILSFSIEDRAVLNARKKRLEKSVIKNPLSKHYQKPTEENILKEKVDYRNGKNNRNKGYKNKEPSKSLKRSSETEPQTDNVQKRKKKKIGKPKNPELHGAAEASKNFKPNFSNSLDEYSGLTSKPGSQHKMRSNFKLRKQAELHRQTVKAEKSKQKKLAKNNSFKKEKLKQPKQKLDTNKNKKISKFISAQKDNRNFTDLVNKYKSKLVSNTGDKVKSKWYES